MHITECRITVGRTVECNNNYTKVQKELLYTCDAEKAGLTIEDFERIDRDIEDLLKELGEQANIEKRDAKVDDTGW